MGSHRGNRLYNGKARMVHERAQAHRARHREDIDWYFEWAMRRNGHRPPVKVVVHGSPPVFGSAGGGGTAHLGSAVSASAPRSPKTSSAPKVEAAAETTTVAPNVPVTGAQPCKSQTPAADRPCTKRSPGPLHTLKPVPMAHTGYARQRFSYGRLACGFVLGTAAGLLALWLIDVVLL